MRQNVEVRKLTVEAERRKVVSESGNVLVIEQQRAGGSTRRWAWAQMENPARTFSASSQVRSRGPFQSVSSSNQGAGTSVCLLYTSPSPRDYAASRMPSSA